jgi:hypothetical protein
VTPHTVYEELAAGHALDALEPEDEELFLRHAATCTRCARDLLVHLETAAALADGADPVELPAGSWERLRAAVVAESGERVFAGGGSEVVPLASRRRPPRALLAAAAAVAVLLVGVGAATTVIRNDRTPAVSAAQQLDAAARGLGEGPGASVHLLSGGTELTAVALPRTDHVSLVVDGLPANPQGSSYVLWAIGAGGTPAPVGRFDVHGRGVQVVRGMPYAGGTRAAGYAITREQGLLAPPTPHGDVLASGTLQGA